MFTRNCKTSEAIWIASAWATTDCTVSSALWNARARLRALVVGLDFHQTDPRILRRFAAYVRVLRVAGVFHPKTYLFQSGSTFLCIVGSSNFTAGGFGANAETNLTVAGPTSDPLFRTVRMHIEALSEQARRLTEPELRDYTRAYERLRALRQRLTRYRPSRQAIGQARLQGQHEVEGRQAPEDLAISWPVFQARVLAQEHDRRRGLRVRIREGEPSFLGVSAETRRLFNRKRILANMTHEERRKVGGLHNDYLYFGSMKGAGRFRSILLRTPGRLDRALNVIPRTGDVAYRHFQAFVRRLPRARIGISTATRLLAMKRPDRFLCVDAKNIPTLARTFGVTRTSLNTFAGYWILMRRIWQCPWFEAPRPRDGLAAAVWNSRVALLDAFYYEP